jgi:hypothetical protein
MRGCQYVAFWDDSGNYVWNKQTALSGCENSPQYEKMAIEMLVTLNFKSNT